MKINQMAATFQKISQADAVSRYSRDRLVVPESVLTHTGWMGLWCIFASQSFFESTGISVDDGVMLKRALLHDIEEVEIGDIPRITKYASEDIRESIAVLEELSMKRLESDLGFRENSLFNDWEKSKDETTFEGLIVKYGDLAATIYKAHDEVHNKGNYTFIRVALEIREHLDDITLPKKAYQYKKSGEWFDEMLDSFGSIINQTIDKSI